MNSKELLKIYWGHDTFRPLQEEIIDSVMLSRDTLALLPTGGGKSYCYQIPALMREGFALVISPLIALMEDQVTNLQNKGIKAMYFESDSQGLRLSQQIDNSINGNFKVVYVSPERLLNPSFINHIKQAKISLIAVDEAHCISEWGHDFRPAFRKINLLRPLFPETPILALTASATPEVKNDIANQLELNSPQIFQHSFERPNIAYNIWNTEDKFQTTLQLLNHFEGSSIVYCNSRKQTEYLANFINQNNHKADFFHGGMLPSEKKEKLEAWQRGTISHMVATTAFGMGIDKANVRTVIHTNLPESIENYYQETGRAGRDGLPAQTFLLYHQGDFSELKQRVAGQFPEAREIQEIYKEFCNYFQIAYGEGHDTTHVLDFKKFCLRYQRAEKKVKQALLQMDKAGVLIWHEGKSRQISIKVNCSVDQARSYVNSSKTSSKILEHIMRQHPYVFSEYVNISMQSICSVLKIATDRLEEALLELKHKNIITFSGNAATLYITFQVPREDQYTIRPVLKIVELIRSQKEKKVAALLNFISENIECKRNAILNYFGEHPKGKCGQCSASSCKSSETDPNFEVAVKKLLQTHPCSISDIKQKLYFDPDDLEKLLTDLLERHLIEINEYNKYYWIDEKEE
jgi:ATP-dependent DNA helicase RecQ